MDFLVSRQAEDGRGGTGLGLNIVSHIVEEHHGKLTLQSEPGQGAAFRIEPPVAPAAPPVQETA